jgi:hypothetical protein
VRSLVVFAGPSLPPEDRIAADGVTYRPSARRGDVLDAARVADYVLLIDGRFQEELAPAPKEVFEACRICGFAGAASIGALRAVECAPYGARAMGTIARWYGTGAVDGDDEVAVVMHPQQECALSVPLVNVRYLLYRARKRHVVEDAEVERVLRRAREVFYAERTWDDVLEAAAREKRAALLALIREGADLKRLDARFALRSSLRRLGRR